MAEPLPIALIGSRIRRPQRLLRGPNGLFQIPNQIVHIFDPDGNRLEFYWENPDWKRESAEQVRASNEKKP